MRYLLVLILLTSVVQAQTINNYISPTKQERQEDQKQLCAESEHDITIDYLNLEAKYGKACKGQACVELVRELHKDLRDNFNRGASSYYSKFCKPQEK